MQILSPLGSSEWDKCLRRFDCVSFFHTSAWARVLADSYGFCPMYGVTPGADDAEAALAIMEVHSRWTGRRGVSLPFTDFCSPLGRKAERVASVTEEAVDLGRGRGWRYVEFRSNDAFPEMSPSSGPYLTHTIDLQRGRDALHEDLHDSVRRAIRKSERSGLRVSFRRDLGAVREFHVLNCLTRRAHGLPPQPWTFFRNIERHVLSAGMGWVVLARCDDRPVAGAVFFHFGDRVIYKYGASDKRFAASRPNNLVMWAAICRYAGEGFTTLSLGRTLVENRGLSQFKKRWGAKEAKLRYVRYDLEQDMLSECEDRVGGWYNHVLRHLPLPCLRIMGRMLYRHMA